MIALGTSSWWCCSCSTPDLSSAAQMHITLADGKLYLKAIVYSGVRGQT